MNYSPSLQNTLLLSLLLAHHPYQTQPFFHNFSTFNK